MSSRLPPTPAPQRPPRLTTRALRILFPPSLGTVKASARAELLEPALSKELDVPVSIVIANDYQDLEQRALANEADMIWVPAVVCARLERVCQRVYKAVRQGKATYCSALVARAGEHVTLEKLHGLRAAWVDARSVGGYLLVVDMLRQKGLEPDTVFASQRFVGSYPNTLSAVLAREADVAAVIAWEEHEHGVRNALTLHLGPNQKGLAVVAITAEAPNDAMMLTTRLAPADAELIADVLFPTDSELRRPSFLLSAVAADTFVRTTVDEYRPLLRLLRGLGSH